MEDRADVRVLPPLILLSAFVTGAALRTLLPAVPFPSSLALWLGSGLVACSIVLVVMASRALATARTAFDVRKSTTFIVTAGVFRITRNPVYLSMTRAVPWRRSLARLSGDGSCRCAIGHCALRDGDQD